MDCTPKLRNLRDDCCFVSCYRPLNAAPHIPQVCTQCAADLTALRIFYETRHNSACAANAV